jgi:hypothetical protein
MAILQKRSWSCVVCNKRAIIELRTKYPCPKGLIPNQNTCDLSTYDGHGVIGGRLLRKRPETQWIRAIVPVTQEYVAPSIPNGGICSECLVREDVARLLPHINFV